MRQILLLLLLPCFIACGKAQKEGAGDTDDTTFSGPIQFKNQFGQYESVDTKDVVSLQVSVTDKASATTIQKTFFVPDISSRLQDLNFGNPGKKSLDKLKKTGTVRVQYMIKGTTLVASRDFDIYDTQYLQDATFLDVVYHTSESLTAEWLK